MPSDTEPSVADTKHSGLQRSKNIVLFSDGTGNSASKQFKTNVWRTYQALDLEPSQKNGPAQVAFYRDGVGTETFKPFAMITGALGFGVFREVQALYRFLCRNYREGNRIYAFGFSRGAFTIRLLIGLVSACGLVKARDERDLNQLARAAYWAYRRDCLINSSKKNKLIYQFLEAPSHVTVDGHKRIDIGRDVDRPEIEFLGLWDTVDAYGLPIEELKQGIDEWIWPLSFADRSLSPIVKHARHALSLDDERPSFTPVLWDESRDPRPERIEQVWFAGVHANVGGGYPIDDLAYITLVWILRKATAAGLRFDPGQMAYFEFMQNVHGTAYDSRAGVAGYYRYGPRTLEKLCDDKKNKVKIAVPKVHESVSERIARRRRSYSPISLPRGLVLMHPDTGEAVQQNTAFVDLAWDEVFRRRITYFATLFLTLFIVLVPLLAFRRCSGACVSCGSHIAPVVTGAGEACEPKGLIDWLVGLAPTWSEPWVAAARAYPRISFALVVVLAVLFFRTASRLQSRIEERSEWAWAAMKGNASPPPSIRWPSGLIRTIRMSPALNRLGRVYNETLIPNIFGPLILVAMGYLIFLLVRWIVRVLFGA